MKKILYVILTFFICYAIKTSDIYIGFVPMLLTLMLFKFDASLLWEIPLATLSCSVLYSAFSREADMLIRIFLPLAAVLIAYSSPKKLLIFFPVAITSLFYKNIYAVSVMAAALWYGVRCVVKKTSDKKIFYHKTSDFTR